MAPSHFGTCSIFAFILGLCLLSTSEASNTRNDLVIESKIFDAYEVDGLWTDEEPSIPIARFDIGPMDEDVMPQAEPFIFVDDPVADRIIQLLSDGQKRQAIEIISTLPDINAKFGDIGLSVLHIAVAYGDVLLLMEILTEFSLDLNLADGRGDTALIEAIKLQDKNMVALLCAAGADVNKANDEGETPLVHAVLRMSTNILATLLNFGADPTRKIEQLQGETVVHLVIRFFNENHLRCLAEHDQLVEWNLQNISGDTPLIVAARVGNEAALKICLRQGADPDIRNNDGNTALHFAARKPEDVNMLKWLLRKGANPNLLNKSGLSALMIATWGTGYATVDLLLQSGARIDLGSQGYLSPIHMAVVKNLRSIVTLFLIHSPSCAFLRSTAGTTPLHTAARTRNASLAKLLLLAGANPKAVDNSGSTPITIASENGYAEIVELLSGSVSETDKKRNPS